MGFCCGNILFFGLVGVLTSKAQAPVCPSGTKAIVERHLNIGSETATAYFSIAPGCQNIKLSMVAYNAGGPGGALPLTLAGTTTTTLSFNAGGEFILTAVIPECYWQIAFVLGEPIANPTSINPYGSNRILYRNGGQACTPLAGELG